MRTKENLEIFCSYAHKDKLFLNALKLHLTPLRRQGLITMWADTEINAGQEWEKEIKQHLDRAKIILLLVSPDFIASDYCYSNELQQAMKRHDLGDARVIPIILRSVYWQGTPFGKLQALPKDAKPIKNWTDSEEALLDVVQGILRIVNELNKQQATSQLETPSEKTGISSTENFSHGEIDRGQALVQQMTPQIKASFARGDWFDVIRKTEFLTKNVPWLVTSAIYRWHGLALLNEGKIEQAQEALTTALTLSSDTKQRSLLLDDFITIFTLRDQWDEAQVFIKEALHLHSRDPIWRAKLIKYKLLTLLQQYLTVLEELQISDQIHRMQELRKDILLYNCRILVIAQFMAGKSTLINALLGQKVLPSYVRPTTAINILVRWGEIPKAVLYTRETSDNLPAETKEVPIDDIEKYILINANHPSFDHQEPFKNPYERMELFLPLDFCRDGIEIVDTHGLNEIGNKDIYAYLRVTDVVLFIISCTSLLGQDERNSINIIRDSGHKTIFFACNRINEIPPEEQEETRQYAQSLLIPLTERGTRSIFFVDARSGVDGRLTGDQEKLDRSGIPLVEKELKSFLATETWQKKFTHFAETLKYSLIEVQNIQRIDGRIFIVANDELLKIKMEFETFIQQNSLEG